MIHGIGHIGIAVRDIEKVVDQFCTSLGMEKPKIKLVAERGMKVAVIRCGKVELELLEDLAPDGPLSGHVKEKGDFIHHLCLITDDIEKDISGLEAKGVKMSGAPPREGLRGKRISFVASGILGDIPVELSEP